VAIALALQHHGLEVKVNDPYYADDEIRQIVGVETFRYPDGLGEFDAVLVTTGHREYRAASAATVLGCLVNCRLILDNAGLWTEIDFAPRGIEYHRAGDRGWLGSGQEKSGPA
jgi:UDP-N-acetyl-D-mannosaminuronate dehydrogenase